MGVYACRGSRPRVHGQYAYPGLAVHSDAELVAVCSRDEKKLAGDLSGVQGNLGGPGERLDFSGVSRYRDIRQMLEDPRVDAVDLCLPTHMHAPVAIQAFEAGKHVLVEKPMALDAASARRMIAEAEKHRRVLMVAQVLRFFPMYQALRRRAGAKAPWALCDRQFSGGVAPRPPGAPGWPIRNKAVEECLIC